MHVDRRQFTKLCVAGLMTLHFGCRDENNLGEKEIERLNAFANKLQYMDACKAVGQDLLDEASTPVDEHKLFDDLFGGANPGQVLAHEQLLKRQRNDFLNNRAVNYKGWLISATEAKLLMLIASL
ncbi:MAG: hypothetical protein ACPGQS_11940 [Bradymonadia bacterium]